MINYVFKNECSDLPSNLLVYIINIIYGCTTGVSRMESVKTCCTQSLHELIDLYFEPANAQPYL